MDFTERVMAWLDERPWTTEWALPLAGIVLSLCLVFLVLAVVRKLLVRKQLLTLEQASKDRGKLNLIIVGVHLALLYRVPAIEATFASWPLVDQVACIVGVAGLCLVSFVITRRVVLSLLAVMVKRSRFEWDDVVFEYGPFNKLSFLAPIGVLAYYAERIPLSAETVSRVLTIAVTVVIVLALGQVCNAVNDLYNRNVSIAKERPIKGYLQVGKLFVYLLGAVVVFAFAIGESPAVMLAGVGAATAVLLLIFKNTILSLVAGIQMATNDMVRLDDWIVMPKQDANGVVTDISLHVVKVKNWDHSTANIPSFKFIEESFNNWRGMWESGGRRIRRAIHIDQASVRFCDAALLTRFDGLELLRGYLDKQLDELEAEGRERSTAELLKSRRVTNLGAFRAYADAYLRAHPHVDENDYLMARSLDPGPHGIPIEIYCYLNIIKWVDYEALQGPIFDHLLATIPEFDLRVYQDPTGADFRGESPNAGRDAPNAPTQPRRVGAKS